MENYNTINYLENLNKSYILLDSKLDLSEKKVHSLNCPLTAQELSKYDFICFYLDTNDTGSIAADIIPINFLLKPIKGRYMNFFLQPSLTGEYFVSGYITYESNKFLIDRIIGICSEKLFLYRIVLY